MPSFKLIIFMLLIVVSLTISVVTGCNGSDKPQTHKIIWNGQDTRYHNETDVPIKK